MISKYTMLGAWSSPSGYQSMIKPRSWREAAGPRHHGRPYQKGGYREVPSPSRGARRDSALSIRSTRLLGRAPGLVDDLLGTIPVGTLTAHCVREYARPPGHLYDFVPTLQPPSKWWALSLVVVPVRAQPAGVSISPSRSVCPSPALNRTFRGSTPATSLTAG